MKASTPYTYQRLTEWPLTIAACVFLAVYAWPILDPSLAQGWVEFCSIAGAVIWCAFGLDYLIRLLLAASRPRFVRENVLDLVVLALPLLRPLRALRAVMALSRINKRAVASFRGRILTYALGSLLLIGFAASVAILEAERNVEGSNIHTYPDALWWVATTISTVGYGDHYPTTTEGRVVGVGLMLGGIALLGVVTASLAAWFVERAERLEEAEEQTRDELAELVDQVRHLSHQLEQHNRSVSDAAIER